MKVLMVNSFHYRRGGDCTYMFALSELLESRGHKIVHFAMDHPNNLECYFSDYFLPFVDYDSIFAKGSFISKARTAPKLLYSFEAKKRFECLINDTHPDIIHIQSIYHLITLSILQSAAKFKLPVVWTLHDYNLMCPNISFVRRGVICEECKGGKYFKAVLNKCKRNSVSASAIICLSGYINEQLQKSVAEFISPSLFLRTKLIEHGFDQERVSHIPHFHNLQNIAEPSANESKQERDYIIYTGRLSPEKGVMTLVRAVSQLGVKLVIAGDGPLLEEIMALKKKNNYDSIELLGHVPQNKVNSLLRQALFLVAPSECYETFSLSILEAFFLGTPVIAADIGAITELIEDQKNGLLFKSGDKTDLAKKIDYLLANRRLIHEMGDYAKSMATLNFGEEEHYQKVMKIYEKYV